MATEPLIPTWEPCFWATPSSDGWKLYAIELDRIVGYETTIEDMPDDAAIDRAVAIAMDRRHE